MPLMCTFATYIDCSNIVNLPKIFPMIEHAFVEKCGARVKFGCWGCRDGAAHVTLSTGESRTREADQRGKYAARLMSVPHEGEKMALSPPPRRLAT